MSNATVANAVAPKAGKKKLIIIIAAVAVLLLGGGGAALMMMKKKAAAAEEEGDGERRPAKAAAAVSHDPKAVPTFVPLEPFTVNLADRDAERYAQVGITLEVAENQTGDRIKSFMPVIRNNILLALSDRTAADLLQRDGKTRLAERIRRESSRALGVEVDEEDEEAVANDEAAAAKKPGKKKKRAEPDLPIRAVHFSTFIIQ